MKDYRSMDRRAPVLPLFGGIVFPHAELTLRLSQSAGSALKAAQERGGYAVALAVTPGAERDSLRPEELPGVGVLVSVTEVRPRNQGWEATLRGLARVRRDRLEPQGLWWQAEFDWFDPEADLDPATEDALVKNIQSISHEILGLIDNSQRLKEIIDALDQVDPLISFCIQHTPVTLADKQGLLELPGRKAQGLRLLEILARQKQALQLQMEMSQKISEQAGRTHRENLLREQLKTIKEELGEGKGRGKKDYRQLLAEAGLPPAVLEAALEEVDKLEAAGSNNPEANVSRNYLDLILALPWKDEAPGSIDLSRARQVLDEDHAGLEKVKDLILQYLAVLKLKPGKKGALLLLVGPPGVGKTSLGRSIARALGREFVRASLGGVRDDADIRGHRRTYIGALPGRILTGLKRLKQKHPVFLLDEVDKLSRGYGGDPAAALLEVLDPEQNSTFTDHYLDLPYDLSQVFFIATANSTETIPAPLLDRMELIQLPGYTEREKLEIARRHLWPKALEEHGLSPDQLLLDEGVLEAVVNDFTREAGVRDLARRLAMLCRVKSAAVVEARDQGLGPVRVQIPELESLLGRKPHRHDQAASDNPPGVATGLAWTPVGGDILFIESAALPGSGEVLITGQLGEVMKESARLALSLVRAHLPFAADPEVFKKTDWHIHVPAGATPKDGPSAGVALLTALTSLVTGRKVDPHLAMTGEISLRGAVLPVGGIKEKVLAAHRAGITRVLLPRANEPDWKDLPEDVRSALTVDWLDTVADVFRLALGLEAVTLPGPFAPGEPRPRALPV